LRKNLRHLAVSLTFQASRRGVDAGIASTLVRGWLRDRERRRFAGPPWAQAQQRAALSLSRFTLLF
jgi:hypothetical protein